MGAGLPKVLAAFGASIAECTMYAPSLLVLDDLDLVCLFEVWLALASMV